MNKYIKRSRAWAVSIVSFIFMLFSKIELLNPNAEEYDKVYDEFKPANIIKEFDLKHFDFTKTSMYGHFGTKGFPWERV